MKKATILLLAILVPSIIQAQKTRPEKIEHRGEICVGLGTWSTGYLFDGYSPSFLGTGKKVYLNHNYSGAYHINFRYFLSEMVSLGLTIAYESESGDWQANYNPDHFAYRKQIIGTFKKTEYTFSPEMSVYYIARKKTKIYCTFGFGLTERIENDEYSQQYIYNGTHYPSIATDYPPGSNNKLQGNIYLSPFGISVGGKISWFAEIGIGYKGVLNTGLSMKL